MSDDGQMNRGLERFVMGFFFAAQHAGRAGQNRLRVQLSLSIVFLTVAGLMSGCNSSSPAGSPAPSAKQVAPAAPDLLDRVANPQIAESEIGVPQMRIACLSPVATEICCALGAARWIVGRSDYCEHPSEVRAVAALGTLYSLKLEALLEAKPDLVLFSGTSRAQAEQIANLKLRVESLPDRTLEDVFVAIRRTGEMLGRPQTATALCASIRADLEQVRRRHAAIKGTRVLVAIEPLANPPRPVSVAGGDSFLDDLLRLSGCQNAVQQRSFFAPLSFEAIVAADPEVIIELCGSPRAEITGESDPLRAWSSLGSLKSVKNLRVRALVGPELFLPGPRVAKLLDRICTTIESANP